MLPTQVAVAIQTDTLSGHSLELAEQIQPQVFSLIPGSNSPDSRKKPRRKKLLKQNDSMPVITNPQISKASLGFTFITSQYRSTSMPESISPFASRGVMNDQCPSSKLHVDCNTYDANNNINNHQIPSMITPSNSAILSSAQQTPIYLSEVVETNPTLQSIPKRQTFAVNPLLTNNLTEISVSVPSLQENEHNHLQSSLTLIDEGSLLARSSSISSSIEPISAPETPSTKPKRRYTKRSHFSVSFERQEQQSAQQTSQYPTTYTQPNCSNGLPTIIPASIRTISGISEEPLLRPNIPIPSNVMLFPSPNSIRLSQSSPTNIMSELPLVPVQQRPLPFTTATIAEMNLASKHCFPTHRVPCFRRTITDTSISNLPFQYNPLLVDRYAQYYMVPSNLVPTTILPMAHSSLSRENVASYSSGTMLTDDKSKKHRSKRRSRKPKLGEKSSINILRDERSPTSKSRVQDFSSSQGRKHRSSSAKEIRTKKQLRRFTRQNRLAVLKFMMRKQKQQKQQLPSTVRSLETKDEEKNPESISSPITDLQDTATSLPNIIASNLKISFNATQKIESIALCYHRRRKSGRTDVNGSNSSMIDENRLDLLVEAVELLETMQGNPKITVSSNT